MKDLPNSSQFKIDKKIHERIQKAARKKESSLPVTNCKNKVLSGNVFLFNKELHENFEKIQPLEISNVRIEKKEKKQPTVNQALNTYSEDRVTPQILRGLADFLCETLPFMFIENQALYLYVNDYYHLFSYSFASRFLTEYLQNQNINYALRSNDFKELVRMIQSHPKIYAHEDGCKTNTNIILFEDGAFDVKRRITREASPDDYQFSKISFPLDWNIIYEPDFEAFNFIRRFCQNDPVKENYLWELIGYLLSSYQQKILVMFLGPSNAGKSTLANMIRGICGSSSCVALGIKDLSGNFNLAELQGKRLCIDSDMDASTLNAKDISLLKKVVGNDLIQGNRKFEQQFYFKCQTKFLICSNNKIRFKSDEDTASFFNRMKIFELEEGISVEEQIHDMDRILDNNRTFFLQQAMRGLCRLVENNFIFSCDVAVENFVENLNHKDKASITDFVAGYCICGDNYEESVTRLYQAYRQFAFDNDRKESSIKKFSSFICENYHVIHTRTKKARFLKGIRLLTDDR